MSTPKDAVNYRLISNGTTLMETLFPGTADEMITMCHLDGVTSSPQAIVTSKTEPPPSRSR